jgi:hypothetical protein
MLLRLNVTTSAPGDSAPLAPRLPACKLIVRPGNIRSSRFGQCQNGPNEPNGAWRLLNEQPSNEGSKPSTNPDGRKGEAEKWRQKNEDRSIFLPPFFCLSVSAAALYRRFAPAKILDRNAQVGFYNPMKSGALTKINRARSCAQHLSYLYVCWAANTPLL